MLSGMLRVSLRVEILQSSILMAFCLGPDVPEPYQYCSSLEVISPDDGFVIDGSASFHSIFIFHAI